MNERDIELAAQAGAHWEHGDWNLASSVHFSEDELQKFAALIRADKREACAAACTAIALKSSNVILGVAVECAEAIRARGNT